MCSTPTWNLSKLRIAQCKLGIPGLAGKLRIKLADSKFTHPFYEI